MVNMAKSNVEKNAAVRRHPALLVFGVIILALAFIVYMLYPVARNYYTTWRENNRLEAEYQALLERNAKIEQLVEALKTPEGIEDWARQQYGWVLEGEKAVNVTGLEIRDSSRGLPSSVEPGSVDIEETWWMILLDFIFGVEEQKPLNPSPEYIIPGL